MKKVSIFLLVIITLMHCAAAHSDGELIDIQAQGSGSSRTQALMNAIDEALRKCMGGMILSREEINNDTLTDKVIQVSRGSIKHSEVLSEKTENGKILLDVKFSVDRAELREAVRRIKPGALRAGAAGIVRRPLLEKGKIVIRAFFDGVDLLEFLELRISDIKIDPGKEEFSAAITITMNKEKYTRLFAAPMAAMLDETLLKPELSAELAGEDENVREAGIIYLLGENKSFRAWTVPSAFLEEIKSAAYSGNLTEHNILQTHRRMWLNISLIDERGKELQLQRIPVILPITNILMFSAYGEKPSPLLLAGSVQAKESVICAPLFGVSDNSGRRYTSIFSDESDPFRMKFTMHMTRSSLSRIRDVSSWLQLEK